MTDHDHPAPREPPVRVHPERTPTPEAPSRPGNLRDVPDHLLGRVNVVARTVARGGQPFGAALGAATLGLRAALLVLVAPSPPSPWPLLGWRPLRSAAPGPP